MIFDASVLPEPLSPVPRKDRNCQHNCRWSCGIHVYWSCDIHVYWSYVYWSCDMDVTYMHTGHVIDTIQI